MGKGKKGGKRVAPRENPVARESDARRAEQLRGMEMRRLKNKVDRQREKMISYEAPEMKKRPKIDPRYDLKGAARAAREFYKDPNYFDDIPNTNLFEDYKQRLYAHEEGRILLQYMMEYGVSLYNNFNHMQSAEALFHEMMELDVEDNLRAKDALLRCYLDTASGEKVRKILNDHPLEKASLFVYSRALIEHISLLLEESGSSSTLRDEMLQQGNLSA